MQILFLGTGTSHGVPILGCTCPTCCSTNKKNKRYRSSIYLEVGSQSLLIDTPPELRLQLLTYKIKKIDAILFTHPHADHLMGFDDIRSINRLNKDTIPCYGNNYTVETIKQTFPYIYNALQVGGGLPQVSFHKIKEPFYFNRLRIIPLPIKHGKLDILGYRIGKFAYITDCSYIPEKTFSLLEGVEVLVIGALRYRTHPTHMNLEQALNVIKRLKVSRAYLTHLSHNLEQLTINKLLPDNVRLGYDGLRLLIY